MKTIHRLFHNLINIPGWRTDRHLVLIESDDWGSIRMPSSETYQKFLAIGVRVDRDPYCRYDGLATTEDLNRLFDVLDSVRDINNRPAILTANAVVANPLFEKIRASGFNRYYYEPITETFQRSSNHTDVFSMWQEGIRSGLFHPQFHGREHLNVKKWMQALNSGDKITRLAFEFGTFGLTSLVSPSINGNYMGAFNSGMDDDILDYQKILKDGLMLFSLLFGYESESFIATTYTWSPKIERFLKNNGVRFLQGLVTQKNPLGDDANIKYIKRNFQGSRSREGLIHLMRNCFFEPSQSPGVDCVDECLRRIDIAFRWKKAAVVCAHRLNFIGSIDQSNADRNLPEFKRLLKEIVRYWPDVEFVSSDELGRIIERGND